MKDKQKKLKDIDLVTELTTSEQEQESINGVFDVLTSPLKPRLVVGISTDPPTPPDPLPKEEDWKDEDKKPQSPSNYKSNN